MHFWEIPVASVMEVLENEHLFDESAAETDVNKAATIGKRNDLICIFLLLFMWCILVGVFLTKGK